MIESMNLASYWKFRTDENDQGRKSGWQNGIPEGAEDIWVPSCWNELREEMVHYEGVAWYFRKFTYRRKPGVARDTLFFYGVNYECEAWLNGMPAGGHTGGFTPFELDITSLLKEGEENLLVLRVDSTAKEMTCPPIGVDWMNYGGIFRDVLLNGTGESWLDDVTVITKMDGTVKLTVETGNFKADGNYSLELKVVDREAQSAAHQSARALPSGKFCFEIAIPAPKLWSMESPFLYDFRLTLTKSGEATDRWEHRIGIREFWIKDRKILLNGRPITLKGYSKHEDYPMLGRTFCREIVRKDYELCKAGTTNFVRMCHYPHDLREYEVASEMGFLAIAEIPNVNYTKRHFENKELMDLAVCQLRETVRYYKNETCILFWSLFVECATQEDAAVAFIPRYTALVKELDPTRFTIHAADNPATDRVYDYFDVVGVNYWFGWYFGDTLESGGRLLDTVAARYPEKPVVMTSGGWEGIYGVHSYRAKAHWSEESQADYLVALTQMYLSRDYIVGEIVWTYNDFRISPWVLDEGDKFRANWPRRPMELNNKGVMDAYRRPKLAYYALQETFKKWDAKYTEDVK